MEHIKAVRSQKRCKIGLWSQWPTNRKSDTHFRLVSKSSTLDDLERLRRTLVQKRCVFWSTLHKFKWRYRVDPYSQPQKCRPITIVSGNIRCMRIFPGVTLGGGLKWEWSCQRRQFLVIWVVTSSETPEIRPAVLDGDMLPLVGLWLFAKWVTYNDLQWLFHVKIRFQLALSDSENLNFNNYCVKSNKHIPMLHGRSDATGTPPKLG